MFNSMGQNGFERFDSAVESGVSKSSEHYGRTVDALTSMDEEGRRSLRKASGRWQPTYDPGMSEWGNPMPR